jgi:hypothetical protein
LSFEFFVFVEVLGFIVGAFFVLDLPVSFQYIDAYHLEREVLDRYVDYALLFQ